MSNLREGNLMLGKILLAIFAIGGALRGIGHTKHESSDVEVVRIESPAKEQSKEPIRVTVTPRVVMHSASWCGPCQAWKRGAKPQWEKLGWEVMVIEDDNATSPYGVVPWFEVKDRDGVEFHVVGSMDTNKFNEAKAKSKR